MNSLVKSIKKFLLKSLGPEAEAYFRYESWKRENKKKIKDYYLDVEEGVIHYQIIGEGEQLLLLHGGFGSINSLMGEIPNLSKEYQLIVPDLRGYGKSINKSDKELDFTQFAEDVEAILTDLRIEEIKVTGISDGATIALQLAINKKINISKMVLVAPNKNYKDLKNEIRNIINNNDHRSNLNRGPLPIKNIRFFYNRDSGNPDYWPHLYKSVKKLWLTKPDFSDNQITNIKINTLILKGDSDEFIGEESLVELNSLLPYSQYKSVKESRHNIFIDNPVLASSLIINFLQ